MITDLINRVIRSFSHNHPVLDSYNGLSDPGFSETVLVQNADYDSEENLQHEESYIA